MRIHEYARSSAVLALAACAGLLAGAAGISAHCQIPCGIYDDQARFDLMLEHTRTIEKSMNRIEALAEEPGKNANQLVRWVTNKDDHADKLVHIVYYYFMQQRIDPVHESEAAGHEAYVHKLALCHNLLVTAMKAKQTTDLAHVERLRELIGKFRTAYFGEQARGGHTHHGKHGAYTPPHR